MTVSLSPQRIHLWIPGVWHSLAESARSAAIIFLVQFHPPQFQSVGASSWLFLKQPFCQPEQPGFCLFFSQFWSSEQASVTSYSRSRHRLIHVRLAPHCHLVQVELPTVESGCILVASWLWFLDPDLPVVMWPSAGSPVKRTVTLIMEKYFLLQLRLNWRSFSMRSILLARRSAFLGEAEPLTLRFTLFYPEAFGSQTFP